MDGMVTDKGFFDVVWCPVTLRDTFNDRHRVKPDRNYDPLEGIHQALSLGQKNRWVNIRNLSPLSREAIPYKESFWLHVPFNEGKLLLTAHRFLLEPITSGEGILTVTRDKRYDPPDDEVYQAEVHLQALIIKYIQPLFPRVKQVRIISRYPTWPQQELADPSEEKTLQAQEFVCYIADLHRGKAKIIPRLEKCSSCWWNACKERLVVPHIQSPPSFNKGVSP